MILDIIMSAQSTYVPARKTMERSRSVTVCSPSPIPDAVRTTVDGSPGSMTSKAELPTTPSMASSTVHMPEEFPPQIIWAVTSIERPMVVEMATGHPFFLVSGRTTISVTCSAPLSPITGAANTVSTPLR